MINEVSCDVYAVLSIDCGQSLFYFLKNLWGRVQNKQACDRDRERDVGPAISQAAGVGR